MESLSAQIAQRNLRAAVATMMVQRFRSSRATLERRCRRNSTGLLIAMTLLFCARRNVSISVGVLQPVVALLFQLKRQFLAALFDDPARRKHVDKVRRNVIEQTLIVRYQNHGLIRVMKFVDAFGDDSERVDVQT